MQQGSEKAGSVVTPKRHFLWIDGQVGHLVSFELSAPTTKIEKETECSSSKFGSLFSNESLVPYSDVLLNTSPVTPTSHRGEGETLVIDSLQAEIPDDSAGVELESEEFSRKRHTDSERKSGRMQKNTSYERPNGDMFASDWGVFEAQQDELEHSKNLEPADDISRDYSENGILDLIERRGLFSPVVEPCTEKRSVSGGLAAVFNDQGETASINSRDNSVPSQAACYTSKKQAPLSLRKQLSQKLKILPMNTGSFSNLLLHRGRPRSPTIDEQSAPNLTSTWKPENINEQRIHRQYLSLADIHIPLSNSSRIDQSLPEDSVSEQSVKSSVFSEKEDLSSLKIVARMLTEQPPDDQNGDFNYDTQRSYLKSGHDVTLTTQRSETNFSATEMVHMEQKPVSGAYQDLRVFPLETLTKREGGCCTPKCEIVLFIIIVIFQYCRALQISRNICIIEMTVDCHDQNTSQQPPIDFPAVEGEKKVSPRQRIGAMMLSSFLAFSFSCHILSSHTFFIRRAVLNHPNLKPVSKRCAQLHNGFKVVHNVTNGIPTCCHERDRKKSEPVDSVKDLAQSPDPSSRAQLLIRLEQAVLQSRQLPDQQRLEVLLELVWDESLNVRYSAISQLSSVGIVDPYRTFSIICEVLKHEKEATLTAAAADVLFTLGIPEAFDELEKLYETTNDWIVRLSIVAGIGELKHPRSFDFLAKALRSSDELVVSTAIGALGELGDLRALDILEPLLQSKDATIRDRAFNNIQRLKEEGR
eukprot:jgi/Galph1/3589/GphlegSOOS_G2307.1